MATPMQPFSLHGFNLSRSPTIAASETLVFDSSACLAQVVNEICGDALPSLDNLSDEERDWTGALATWYHLNGLLLIEGAQDELRLLSDEQKTSFRLLREWWTAQYQRPETAFGYVNRLVERGCQLPTRDDGDIEFVQRVEHSLGMVRHPHDVAVIPSADRSTTYNGAMLKLFELEFGGRYGKSGKTDSWAIRPYRRGAVIAAWTQQIAFASFREHIIWWSENQDSPDQYDLWHLPGVRVPRDIVDKYRPSPVTSVTGFDCSILTPPPIQNGPAIKACPWLTTGRTGLRADMPYYVWDRETHQTVATGELVAFAEYTCISHTWGRYTLPSWETAEYVPVAGVPWKVPRNSKFEITELGSQLDKLLCNTRYIWIDLFCIPQDGSDIMAIEIARQAQIFQNATHAVAWLNDVESFDVLSMALTHMAISLLYLPPDCEEQDFAVHLLADIIHNMADKPTGLLARDGTFDFLYIQSNPWFTSLWTLQELCLRPDMWLCSADWDILGIVDNEPMPVIGVAAFWYCFQHGLEGNRTEEQTGDVDDYFFKFRNQPLGESPDDMDGVAFAEISHWMNATALNRLLDMSRADILAIGDKRVCSSRRAEAIMSCLGMTKWYLDTPRTEHEKSLVLNKYPIAFVAEVQAADPMEFFGRITKWDHNPYDATGIDLSIALNPANRPDPARPDDFEHIPAQPRGTVLPFSLHGCVVLPSVPSSFDDSDCHESIKSWVVRPDGRVHISQASILASSVESYGPFQHIECFFPSSTTPDTAGSIDLRKWISHRTFECHALVVGTRILYKKLKVDGIPQVGAIVFHGFTLGRFSDELFVKLSSFVAVVRKRAKMPQTVTTDWLVA